MAFENVNVNNLKNAIRSCKSAIKYEKVKTISNNLSSDAALVMDSKEILKSGLDKLITKNEELKKELDKGLVIASYIESYQKLQNENKLLTREIRELERDLRHEDDPDDADKIERRIRKLERQKNSNINEMSRLLTRVRGYV